MSQTTDTASGDRRTFRGSLSTGDGLGVLVSLTAAGVLMLGIGTTAVARVPPAPLALPIIFGLIGLTALIAPYLPAKPYYVVISDSHVAAGRKRAAPSVVVERDRVAHAVRRTVGRNVFQFEMCAADRTTLLRMDRWISSELAAEMARTLDVPFWPTGWNHRADRP